jgi:hypothetical protein
MMKPGQFPSSIPCGSCGASTPVSWVHGPKVSTASGSCPNCGFSVFSVAGDSVPVEVFLNFLESLPDESLPPLFGSLKASGLQGCRL